MNAQLTASLRLRQAVETVLGAYPYHPYRQAFAMPQLHEHLLLYVGDRCSEARLDLEAAWQQQSELPASPELDPRLQMLISEGIHHLMNQHTDWITHRIPHPVEASDSPSNWFG